MIRESIWEELKLWRWKLQIIRGTYRKQNFFLLCRAACQFDKFEGWFIASKNFQRLKKI